MESLETAAFFIDELLDFSSDIGDEEEEEDNNKKVPPFSSSSSLPLDSKPSNQQQQLQKPELNIFDPEDVHHPFPEFLEEELEWLSNENAFPAVEAFVDIFLDNPITGPKRQSPVSVLEKCSSNSGSSSTILSCYGSLHVPVRARSKRRRRRRNNFSNLSGQQWLWWCCEAKKNKNNVAAATTTTTTAMSIATMGRKCTHCLADKTPQWRAGPLGPKTLCNACGVRYKSGRLVPEYRPASSPTFSSEVHSNSHRKILEMRKHKPNS